MRINKPLLQANGIRARRSALAISFIISRLI